MYYAEIEVDNELIGVEVDKRGEVFAYYLMSDSDNDLTDRHFECVIEHLIEKGVPFND